MTTGHAVYIVGLVCVLPAKQTLSVRALRKSSSIAPDIVYMECSDGMEVLDRHMRRQFEG